DGVRHSKQRDRDEAIMDAKLKAIEKAGVSIKAVTEVENFMLKKDWIESKAEAYLLPGSNIIDVGYGEDGLYHVVLVGKVSSKRKKAKYVMTDSDGLKIITAIENTDLEAVQSFIERGLDVNSEIFMNPMLQRAVFSLGKRKHDLIRLLLENGADANIVYDSDDHRFTPLMVAARLGDVGAVQILLGYGANIHLRSNPYSGLHDHPEGQTALDIAMESRDSVSEDKKLKYRRIIYVLKIAGAKE
ncbi:unnamed protein product, partial [marine sediment metagenome]